MKHIWQVTLLLTLLFFSAQLIGLVVVAAYVDVEASEKAGQLVWKSLPSIAGVEVERPDVEPQFSIWYILAAVIIGTILILLIIKLKTLLLWKIWFYLAVALCLQIAFAAFISDLYALVIAAILAGLKIFKPNIYLHNFTELFIYGGLAAIFVPILTVPYAFLLLLALSLYDMYAVWKSKHMIAMAKFQTKSGIFAGLLLPYQMPAIAKVKPQKIRTAVLGGGDIGFPLIFSGTVLTTAGFWNALLVSAGATVSLAVLLALSQKDKFYPAMPFLTMGCVMGYLATLL